MREASDVLAAEEPLEIRVGYGPAGQREHRTLSITMRTPGHDFELAAGFLFTEGIIRSRADLQGVLYCPDVEKEEERENVVRAELSPHRQPRSAPAGAPLLHQQQLRGLWQNQHRGRARRRLPRLPAGGPHVAGQRAFTRCPSASARPRSCSSKPAACTRRPCFRPTGELLLLREDVGRHNALDKVIGAALFPTCCPCTTRCYWSAAGPRSSWCRKRLWPASRCMAAVGAPSSLAVSAARDFGLTLCGFVRQQRFNIYCHEWRMI